MKSIGEAIATINERDYMMDFLDQLREKSYTIDFDVKSSLGDVPQNAYEYVSEVFVNALNQGRLVLMQEIDRAHEEIKSMQLVTLTTPIEPTNEFAWKIKEWFRNEAGRNVLLDFKLDTSLIGGAVVESSGFRTELSFRQYLEGKMGGGNGF